eukprot:4649405-Prymnesium_polylepis.1
MPAEIRFVVRDGRNTAAARSLACGNTQEIHCEDLTDFYVPVACCQVQCCPPAPEAACGGQRQPSAPYSQAHRAAGAVQCQPSAPHWAALAGLGAVRAHAEQLCLPRIDVDTTRPMCALCVIVHAVVFESVVNMVCLLNGEGANVSICSQRASSSSALAGPTVCTFGLNVQLSRGHGDLLLLYGLPPERLTPRQGVANLKQMKPEKVVAKLEELTSAESESELNTGVEAPMAPNALL